MDRKQRGHPLKLPEPHYDGNVSIERALRERRSVRDYAGEPMTLTEVSQVLWAAQGVTGPNGERTAASAGALYPLEVYVVVGNVTEMPEGVYRYRPHQHALAKISGRDVRAKLAAAALNQNFIADAAINLVFTAVFERTTGYYGKRGEQYVHAEVGHAAQNVHLQAAAMGLGTVVVGAFDDDRVIQILDLPRNERPLYLMPMGRKISALR